LDVALQGLVLRDALLLCRWLEGQNVSGAALVIAGGAILVAIDAHKVVASVVPPVGHLALCLRGMEAYSAR
jgi:hypothetical protein